MHRFLRIVCGVALLALIWSNPLLFAAGTGDFCDSTADHGTSKSCKEEARATGLLVCPAGTSVANLNCSVGQSCNSGNGSWCRCTYDCITMTIADPDPIDPVDGDGTGGR
jgi:hypothetical protein